MFGESLPNYEQIPPEKGSKNEKNKERNIKISENKEKNIKNSENKEKNSPKIEKLGMTFKGE